ncbi:uncharacterized protein E5676_scaffold600G001870 [Cucumis melo var. makuwa]|nr:uncharacterized protein E6C27_scaffold61G001790 [Cucumis melo var. makuwa]TYK28350.1 uncharacterized protein E5676_scaffold600G001870 [Cucumis melo var. makuwa]
MGLQSCVRAKRLWNVLKVTLILMARKGLISKRRFIMDMNLMVKRGKVFRKSVTNYFMFHHHHNHSSHRDMTCGGFGIQDYEFSCSNTPINSVFSHMSKRSTKYQTYFPCINLPVEMETRRQQQDDDEEEEEEEEDSYQEAKADSYLLMTPENTLNNHLQYNGCSFALSPAMEAVSPFNVRISNYSSEEENEISSESGQVDNQAEEFIRRFYEQLKMQKRLQLLQYN